MVLRDDPQRRLGRIAGFAPAGLPRMLTALTDRWVPPPPEARPRSTVMQLVRTAWARLVSSEPGQGLAEYALILALIAIVSIVALIFLGSQISTIVSRVGTSI